LLLARQEVQTWLIVIISNPKQAARSGGVLPSYPRPCCQTVANNYLNKWKSERGEDSHKTQYPRGFIGFLKNFQNE
jgi:hypothetical protein